MLQRGAPKPGKDGKPMKDKHGKVIYEPYRIKVLNTINFKKSMHYNPFAYIHSEKDILKLVTTLIANTKGEGKAGDDFWVKAETLLYCALIGYIHYEAPVEEQNFSTLIEFINAMEVREDDEEFKNPVDLMHWKPRSQTTLRCVSIRNISWPPVIYALSDFLIMILSWLVKQSLRAFLFQEVQL
jgi:type IV secretion system protein VirD4